MLKKLITVMFALAFAAGCQTKSMDSSGAGAGGAHGHVVPGTQGDLEANVGDRVHFALDSSSINHEAQEVLTRQATWLKANPNVTVTVEGHCDERGTREYNLALGERRAHAVRNYLVHAGIEASRISTISYGKERPAVMGTGDAVWAQNRRGVTVVN